MLRDFERIIVKKCKNWGKKLSYWKQIHLLIVEVADFEVDYLVKHLSAAGQGLIAAVVVILVVAMDCLEFFNSVVFLVITD